MSELLHADRTLKYTPQNAQATAAFTILLLARLLPAIHGQRKQVTSSFLISFLVAGATCNHGLKATSPILPVSCSQDGCLQSTERRYTPLMLLSSCLENCYLQ